MSKLVKELFTSKKFVAFLVGLLLMLLAELGFDADQDVVWQIVTLVASYITGQGLADFGKEQFEK